MTNIPAKVEDLTPELMTALLSAKQPGIVVERVEIIENAQCGDGLASTADRIGFRLHYKAGTNKAGVPQQMKMKTIMLHRFLRFGLPVLMATANFVNALDKIPVIGKFSSGLIFRLVNVYQRFFPHAPVAMYLNEVNFYGKLRDGVDVEAPACYASVINEDDGQFGIFMEDLSLRQARFPNALQGVSLEDMKGLIINLAKLHAHFWQSPRFNTDLNWLPKTYEGGMFPVFDAIGLNLIRDQVAKNPFKQRLIAPLGRSVDQLWHANWKSQHIIYRQPHTVLHGDTHIANTYLLPGNKGGLLDFQLMVRGPWCHDLAYLIITGLDIDVRRQHECELLDLYRNTLLSNGVTNVPSADDAFLLYRQSAIWGLVIGWLITPPQNYGEPITSANIHKIVTAMLDLETLQSIDSAV